MNVDLRAVPSRLPVKTTYGVAPTTLLLSLHARYSGKKVESHAGRRMSDGDVLRQIECSWNITRAWEASALAAGQTPATVVWLIASDQPDHFFANVKSFVSKAKGTLATRDVPVTVIHATTGEGSCSCTGCPRHPTHTYSRLPTHPPIPHPPPHPACAPLVERRRERCATTVPCLHTCVQPNRSWPDVAHMRVRLFVRRAPRPASVWCGARAPGNITSKTCQARRVAVLHPEAVDRLVLANRGSRLLVRQQWLSQDSVCCQPAPVAVGRDQPRGGRRMRQRALENPGRKAG